ncbi:fasciclin domain-containing protein [Tenacibaculum sp. SG-28]|uniref:fasciclin domain-containing protein n=1 Tax=Tenacibaculum sp. SG-28 TaxID=754426 RepID=UPI001E550F2E|nr:fasciclin domain-containing protein [Tenacibaculum sp. SG-28]
MFIKKLKPMLALAILMSATFFYSCDDDDPTPAPELPKNIVEIASETPELSILVEAVLKADLAGVLSGEGPLTVFAPTNEAFVALLDSNPDWNSLDDIPVSVLTSVLTFHVLPQEVKSTDLTDGYVETLSSGPNDEAISLQINVMGGVKFNGDANPILTDVMATNGVIHLIDKVMLPPTIVNLAANNDNFSTLVAALTDTRHTTEFLTILNSEGPFTVFAPTNDAFQNLLDSNPDWNGLGDIPIATLEEVLKYHVVNGANVQANQLTNNQEVTMLNEGKITFDLSGATPKIVTETAGQDVSITATDVQGTNGVIHVVDTVLLPEFPDASKTIVDIAQETPELSFLVDAVIRADLVDALSAAGPLTVFAPSNDAFQALLDSNSDWNTINDIPVDVLTNVLTFHVLDAAVRSSDLTDSYVNTLATGPNDEPLSLQVMVTDGVYFNGDAEPTLTDVEASNGVVHIIDKVMLPPNVVTLATNNSNFSILVQALTDERHTTDFVSVLTGDGPFTIFAPTNAAFQALLDSNDDWDGLGDIPIETLDAVLKYHVLNGANVQSDQLTNNQEVSMLSGDTITIDLSGSTPKIITTSDANQDVSITATDVQGTNG